jgi:hypothetical protein
MANLEITIDPESPFPTLYELIMALKRMMPEIEDITALIADKNEQKYAAKQLRQLKNLGKPILD